MYDRYLGAICLQQEEFEEFGEAYKKVYIKAGESIDVCIDIDENMLKFWDENMKYLAENGEFDVYVGEDSSTENSARFTLA